MSIYLKTTRQLYFSSLIDCLVYGVSNGFQISESTRGKCVDSLSEGHMPCMCETLSLISGTIWPSDRGLPWITASSIGSPTMPEHERWTLPGWTKTPNSTFSCWFYFQLIFALLKGVLQPPNTLWFCWSLSTVQFLIVIASMVLGIVLKK